MSQKKEKKINLNELTEEELLKYEVAEELGLLDRVLNQGWKSLSFQGDRKNRRYGQPKEEGEKRRKVIRKRSQGKRGNI